MSADEQAALFRAWVEQYAGLMGRVARVYAVTEVDCQDLVQEVLFQIWRSIPRFEGKASASTWIYRVALNTALAWQRKDRRRKDHFSALDEVPETAVAVIGSADGVREPEIVEQLYAAIRQLPKAEAALVLLYLDDLSYREMAEVLGISESNVGVKLNRARKALAELMREVVCES